MKRLYQIISLVMVMGMALSACATVTPETVIQTVEVPVEKVVKETQTVIETKVITQTVEVPAEVSGIVLPRKETLYFSGFQWSPVVSWNPYATTPNNAMVISDGPNNPSPRLTMFEVPYMYNMLTGELIPLLADGAYTWNDAMTELTFKIKPVAKWSDGTPVTADDIAYTFATNVKYSSTNGLAYKDYIDTIEAVDPATVLIKAKLNAAGKAANPLQLLAYISNAYVVQKAWTVAVEMRTAVDKITSPAAFKADGGEDVPYSGPYHRFFNDDQKIVLVRDDNYWGQDASMWGKLPAPKYLVQVIYADNAAGFAALKAGEVDISQEYNANVQDLWLKDNLPISTYLPEAPYHVASQIPTAWYNLKTYGLDNPVIRKAIAIAVDYDQINANAMTNQSPTFTQVPRSVMNPTAGEQALYDQAAVKDLQWAGKDVEGAKKMLDEAGILDNDGDGWREYKGKKLSYIAACPNGWSDWQASMEIVAAAGKNIGIDITTYYPEWGVYQTVFINADQTEYDIFMWSGNGSSPINPWGRVRQFMSSEFVGQKGNWVGNYGGYSNKRVDEIIAAIPNETDPEKLKALYTEATKIYLTDVPSFALMYRPLMFHTVNETVWTNYPNSEDGLNIPPLDFVNGYSIAGLYRIKPVGE